MPSEGTKSHRRVCEGMKEKGECQALTLPGMVPLFVPREGGGRRRAGEEVRIHVVQDDTRAC